MANSLETVINGSVSLTQCFKGMSLGERVSGGVKVKGF